MQQKEIILVNKGMNRDLSVSKVDGSAAYDNRNIRLIATDKDTLLSVTNERGNKKVNNIFFVGTLVGYGVLNDYIILFTVEDTVDEEGKAKSVSYIYRVKYENDSFSSIVIFAGSLGFSADSPIETIVDYETEDIQKIYWIDGLHVLRFLNFSDAYLTKHLVQGYTLDDPQFDFADNTTWFDSTRTSTVIPTVKITKDNAGNTRANGVAQYFITYYNKNGQQTGIVYSSPLVYLAPEGRGGAADQTNTNSVTVSVSDLDKTFENVRLYNIIRTSLDGQVTGNIVGESSIVNGTATFVDDGAHYTSVDPTSFLFLGSSEARFGTMTQKDGTLFLGNIQSAGNEGVDNIEKKIQKTSFILSGDSFTPGTDWESNIVEFVYSDTKNADSETGHIPYVKAEGYYPYESQLNYTSKQITTFKGGEKYRFALRFVRSNGVQSKAFWIGDKVNPYYPKMLSDGYVKRAIAKCYVPELVIGAAQDAGYSSVKLMIAQATYADRSVKAQGIVCPTVFNLYDRTAGKVYARSSWFYRMRNGRLSSTHFSVLGNANSEKGEVQCNWWDSNTQNTPFPLYKLDSAGDLVDAPSWYSIYPVIEVTITLQRSSGLRLALRDIDFDCRYYESLESTTVADRRHWFAEDLKSDEVVTFWQRYEEQAGIPVSLRASKEDIEAYIKNPDPDSPYKIEKQKISSTANMDLLFAAAERQYHFVDESVVTLNSPEISYEAVNFDNSLLSFRITGIAEITAGIADYDITAENSEYSGQNVDRYDFSLNNISASDSTIAAWPLFTEFGLKVTEGSDPATYEKEDMLYHYMVYPWHKSGSILDFGDSEAQWSVLQTKRFANLHFAYYTFYNNYDADVWSVVPDGIRQLAKQSSTLYTIKADGENASVAGNADDVILSPAGFEYPLYYSTDYADGFPQLSELQNVKTSSDSVRLTYATDAQAIISLPVENSYHTLLPRLLSEEEFSVSVEDTETGPYIPWQSLSAANKLRLYRIVDETSSTALNTITKGAYAGFTELYASSATLTARSTTASSASPFLEDIKKRVNTDYGSSSVYVHLTTTNSAGTNTTRIVNIAEMVFNRVTIDVRDNLLDEAGLFGFKIHSVSPMSSLTIEVYQSSVSTPDCSRTWELNGATESPDDFVYVTATRTALTITVKITFAVTYRDSSGTAVSIIPDFTYSYDGPAGYIDTTRKVISHYTYINSAPFIDYTANTTAYNFYNVAHTPVSIISLHTDHKFYTAGLASGAYNVKQNVFTLTDSSLFTETMPYMFIGEVYKDFDALAEQDPALDTRYGGITENAIEANTFVDAGSAISLDALTSVESYKTTEISGAAIKNAILDKQRGLTFVLGLYSKTEGVLEIMDYSSLAYLKLADLLPTSSSPTSGLTLSYNEEQDIWVSKIDGLSDAESDAITSSAEYKIVLLRYGYARRGTKRYYTAKNTGAEQWSHTSRQNEFKTQRGGKRMRIIGYDILYSGKTIAQMAYSSTWRTHPVIGTYEDYTLVSALGDELILPGLRNDAVTASGRYSEKAKNSIIDLYIGLYHKEGSEWKQASNLVQVRGRSDDYKQIWEFDKSNIAYTAASGK